eukprot:2155653-Amphidinium_carterae.1
MDAAAVWRLHGAVVKDFKSDKFPTQGKARGTRSSVEFTIHVPFVEVSMRPLFYKCLRSGASSRHV